MADESQAVEVVEVTPMEVVPLKPDEVRKLSPFEQAKTIEAELFTAAAADIRDAQHWKEWDPSDVVQQDTVYCKWIELYGIERANQIRNIVRAAWQPKKDAPVAIEMAMGVYAAGVKARAAKDSQPTMNVQLVQMTTPMPQFPRKRIDEENK